MCIYIYRYLIESHNTMNTRVLRRVTWLIPMCTMTQSHVHYDTWYVRRSHMLIESHNTINTRVPTRAPRLDSLTCAPRLIHICTTTHDMYIGTSGSLICTTQWIPVSLHVCHDTFTCAPWLIHMCTTTHDVYINTSYSLIRTTQRIPVSSQVYHETFICAPCLIHMCTVSHSHVHRDTFTCELWLIRICTTTHDAYIATSGSLSRTTQLTPLSLNTSM